MRYLVVRDYTVAKKRYHDIISKENTLDKANEQLTKNTNKNGTLRVCVVPDIKAGLKLYRNGIHKDTIITECSSIWLINNAEMTMDILTPCRKEFIDNWFALGYYDESIEEYDERFIDNVHYSNFGDVKDIKE